MLETTIESLLFAQFGKVEVPKWLQIANWVNRERKDDPDYHGAGASGTTNKGDGAAVDPQAVDLAKVLNWQNQHQRLQDVRSPSEIEDDVAPVWEFGGTDDKEDRTVIGVSCGRWWGDALDGRLRLEYATSSTLTNLFCLRESYAKFPNTSICTC